MMSREEMEERAKKIISDVAEEVMLNIFGRKALESIIRAMREKYFLDLDEISERPQIFSEALRRIIGVGSIIIEDLIIENLYIKMGLEFKLRKGYNFADYINEIKDFLEGKIRIAQTK
ncbi:MAG: hypothetical protein QXR59_03935 [Candidatus Bathyarchaeia archaeon]